MGTLTRSLKDYGQPRCSDAGSWVGTKGRGPWSNPELIARIKWERRVSHTHDLPARWQERAVMVLQVLPSEGLDVGVDAADLGALGLLQLPLQLLPVCILHGFDGCEGSTALAPCTLQPLQFLIIFKGTKPKPPLQTFRCLTAPSVCAPAAKGLRQISLFNRLSASHIVSWTVGLLMQSPRTPVF